MRDEKDKILFACKKCGKKMNLVEFRELKSVCKKCRALIDAAQQQR